MDIEEYAELLESQEWKEKREQILKRDHYTCQLCGARGYTNSSFTISGYSEIDKLMQDCSIEEKPVSTFFKSIKWDDKSYAPRDFSHRYVQGNRYLISLTDKDFPKPVLFAADDYPIYPAYNKYIISNLTLRINHVRKELQDFHTFFVALRWKNKLGKQNYFKVKDGCIAILINNRLFGFLYNKYNIREHCALNFATLHVHHKLYILNRKPWEYNDDKLVTLCSDCHGKIHQTHKTPLLLENGMVINQNLRVCDRCGGRGELPQYRYYMNGICFKCHGAGILGDHIYGL